MYSRPFYAENKVPANLCTVGAHSQTKKKYIYTKIKKS